MSSDNLVSVILPTRNRASTLGPAMQSVLGQTHRDLELIVVDDASTDDTPLRVGAFDDPRVRYLRREEPRGAAAARNAGIALATGAWIAFQDSDDEWLLDKLGTQLRAVHAAGPSHGMAVCRMMRRLPNRVRVHPPLDDRAPELTAAAILSTTVAYVQTWLVRRDVLAAAGPFDETLRVCEDWELLIRLSQRTRILAVPDALAVSTQRADSITANDPDWGGSIARVVQTHAGHFARYPRERADLEYLLARFLYGGSQRPQARAVLARLLRQRPAHWRAWALLCATLVLPRPALAQR